MTSTVTEHTKSLLRAALDNAFRAGADAMREACADRYDADGFAQYGGDIRAMPLPLPPITAVDSPSFEASNRGSSGVPASPAEVSSSGDAG